MRIHHPFLNNQVLHSLNFCMLQVHIHILYIIKLKNTFQKLIFNSQISVSHTQICNFNLKILLKTLSILLNIFLSFLIHFWKKGLQNQVLEDHNRLHNIILGFLMPSQLRKHSSSVHTISHRFLLIFLGLKKIIKSNS